MKPQSAKLLPASFFNRNTLDVAHDLVGNVLVRRWRGRELAGRIIETEAYRGFDDKASHASRGRTPRTAVMFGPAGVWYVYLIYGMYHCLNVVTEAEDFPAAVLIRAVQPLAHVSGQADGPGKLCRAMHISRAQNGKPFLKSGLWIEDWGFSPGIGTAPRIGIDYAGESAEWPWRFFEKP